KLLNNCPLTTEITIYDMQSHIELFPNFDLRSDQMGNLSSSKNPKLSLFPNNSINLIHKRLKIGHYAIIASSTDKIECSYASFEVKRSYPSPVFFLPVFVILGMYLCSP
ncbi:MAG: hypothetical protein WD512_05860, partial [Candidatus Paceibacterota bacterium]